MKVALATSRALPELDEDGPLLRAALAAAGLDARPAIWDDDSVDWAGFDLVVIRSTWDYSERREAYVAWAGRVGGLTRLCNPAEVVRWNTDKRYLLELAAAGVPVVDTHLVEPGAGPDRWRRPFERVPRARGGELVVKPAVSAGARNTQRYAESQEAEAIAHIEQLLAAGRSVLLQPYIASVDRRGETALVFIDGQLSHAICKAPLLPATGAAALAAGGLFASETISRRDPSAAEREVAGRVLRRFAAPLLYARVDLVLGEQGPELLELEVTEPSLFLRHADGAADRLARAIAARLS